MVWGNLGVEELEDQESQVMWSPGPPLAWHYHGELLGCLRLLGGVNSDSTEFTTSGCTSFPR